jgi:hypothetical protein
MRVTFDISTLASTRWYEYGVRFLFGGAITVIAGLLAFGGLFLAFPAIFLASATLVEKHERDKKHEAGIVSTMRGRQAAALDARGATIGSFGLVCFALLVWKLLPVWNAGVVLIVALSLWLGVSVLIWRASKLHWGR